MRFSVASVVLLMLFLIASVSSAATSSARAPFTTNTDDSCDLAVTPAATLLLPYFEVDLVSPAPEARTTVFNVINVSPLPQIARATIWTDWAYPVLTFNIPLTGYDVEAVNLRDLIARGVAPTATGPDNPNILNSPNGTGVCPRVTNPIPPQVMIDVRAILTSGFSAGNGISCLDRDGRQVQLGSKHAANIAGGYVTIDLVANCNTTMPHQPAYFTSDLLYDNILTGDFVRLDPKGQGGYASASPLVHIRAVPEGGIAGSRVATSLPYTFYDHFSSNKSDRRQPLPSAFAARWIQGGPTGFQTQMTIWREGLSTPSTSCDQYVRNASMPVVQIVRFDENENAVATSGAVIASGGRGAPTASPAGVYATTASIFPALAQHDVGGWFFLNLNNGASGRASQNWVATTLFAEGRYGVDITAAALVNGCAQPIVAGTRIGPQ